MNKVWTLALDKTARQFVEMAQANPVAPVAAMSGKKVA
jgi:hypothetical protein